MWLCGYVAMWLCGDAAILNFVPGLMAVASAARLATVTIAIACQKAMSLMEPMGSMGSGVV